MVRPIDLADGYFRVPAGKLVNAVTWFEIREPPRQAPPRQAIDTDVELAPVTPAEIGLCRHLFVAIGTPWLWSLAYAPKHACSEEYDHPKDIFFARFERRSIGIVAFEGRDGRDVEITWFGLTPEATGRKLGRRVMAAALALAWRSRPDRVWLHTCSFDHPAATRFYSGCGFVPYATGFEIMDDPRLTGQLPRDAAPQVPLIEL